MVQAQDGVNIVVALKDMGHDLDTIAAQITPRTRLIFLDNPNNPTGTVFDKACFDRFLAKVPETVIVVLDEAYVDFVDHDLRLDVREYMHGSTAVVGLRTFSKAYGIAGLRVGFGIMNAEIASFLHRVRQPFNVNELAQVGALACLQDDEHYQNTMAMTREGMVWLTSEINKLGCQVFASQTNFFLVDVACDCKDLYGRMLHLGVIVRPMAAYGYASYIRITVGVEAENRRLVGALAQALEAIRGK
jgi:histidinol-phosphate aminotransferase